MSPRTRQEKIAFTARREALDAKNKKKGKTEADLVKELSALKSSELERRYQAKRL